MGSDTNKQFIINQLLWLGISLGISISISILVPFPISLVTIIGVFILLNFYMRKRMMKRMGIGDKEGGVGMFGSLSSTVVNGSLRYYCMNCGALHKKAACPKCNSKMKRVGF